MLHASGARTHACVYILRYNLASLLGMMDGCSCSRAAVASCVWFACVLAWDSLLSSGLLASCCRLSIVIVFFFFRIIVIVLG